MEAPNPSSSSLRVLIRPPSSTPATTSSSSTNSSDFPFSSCRSSDGVVVVGFIGKKEEDLTQLINRIVDDNVFGSGSLDRSFMVSSSDFAKEEVGEKLKDWFQSRQIRYYFEEERGIVFLMFVSNWCVITEEVSEPFLGLDSAVEEREFGDLQGMLFMFSVCHVIIYLQEGSHFDTQLLKRFRLLQDAKHALIPFVKSHIKPSPTSKSSSPSTQSIVLPITSKNPSTGRVGAMTNGAMTNRHSSSISLMSGLGSYPSLFPGQCTPVALFVFLDDFSECPNSSSHIEDSAETFSLNQSSSLSGLARPSLPMKGSSSVVVLSRPMNKSEGGLRKKLQSSLEVQIRFLIKKCRTLAGCEGTQAGSRGGGNVSSAPLFSLEASRAVALLDRSTNQKGESLDFVTDLVEEILQSKATSDILLLERHAQGSGSTKEDIQSIKDFICRQSDTLRGRGVVVGNANSGSAAGVGMVAVAAAAAAASAASGKPFATPELPSLENWLSCCQLILGALLSARRGCLDINDIVKRKPLRRNAVAAHVERILPGGIDPVEAALCWLESGKDLNMKFSTSWCQKALPVAKEVYLKDLPACYPTSLHEVQLQKALDAFYSMVKGPATQLFRKKLEDECTTIWRSGRQLCDAVSLTGKPCIHHRHNIKAVDSLIEAQIKPHSSGFVFLHACACGRSRRLRDDPFDFETANITFSRFPNCDDHLPALQLPKVNHAGPIQPSSWSLIRVGGAKYYQPSKGLLQSGFCSTEKYLFKWLIFLEKQKTCLPEAAAQKGSVVSSNVDPKVVSVADAEEKKAGSARLFEGEARAELVGNQRKSSGKVSDDKKINFGKFSMRRPFAEVVAGSIATDAAFPPLQQRKFPLGASEKGIKQRLTKGGSEEQVYVADDSPKLDDIPSAQDSSNGFGANDYSDGNSFSQIGSNAAPLSLSNGETIKSSTSLKHVTVYVGFEHECSYGHRFLLKSEHLNELGSLYSLPEELHLPSSIKYSEREVADSLNLTKNSAPQKVLPRSNGFVATGNNTRTSSKSKQNMANGIQRWDGFSLFSVSENEEKHSKGKASLSKSVNDLEENRQYVSLDDPGCAFSLLNRNLPIYMNCPHCRISKNKKKDQQKVKFASTVSQLQRIFLVTPPFPTVLATSPVVQFEASSLPPSTIDRERQSQFSIGCRVILPPDSFLTLRLPFVYGVQLEDKSLHPLNHLEHQPELTAWIAKGTTLELMSKGSSLADNDHK